MKIAVSCSLDSKVKREFGSKQWLRNHKSGCDKHQRPADRMGQEPLHKS
jgi:hypothetical protein